MLFGEANNSTDAEMDAIPGPPKSPTNRASAHLTGVVIRIIAHTDATWAEVVIDGADNLYREIRVPYPLQNENGTITRLKTGDRVSIFVMADKGSE